MTIWNKSWHGLSAEERFWQRVDKRDPSECWEWRGGTHSTGYGWFTINYRAVKTHRFSWELHNGQIPNDMCVCHHCDNPRCVNPAHLFLGSHADNMVDKKRKGRAGNYFGDQSGEKNRQAKLTSDQVRVLKANLDAGVSQYRIAEMFGIKQPTVSDIKRGKIWAHI